jgi:hypothetical protein
VTRATTRNELKGALLAFAAAAMPAPNVAAQDDANGIAQPCIRPSNIDRTRIIDNRNMLFFMRDDSVLHNVLPDTCPQLRSEGRFAYDKGSDRLCAQSSITVIVERGISGGQYLPGPVCRLGMFVPVTEDEVDDLLALSKKGKRSRNAGAAVEATPVELPPDAARSTAPEAASPEPAPAEAARPDIATEPPPAEAQAEPNAAHERG